MAFLKNNFVWFSKKKTELIYTSTNCACVWACLGDLCFSLLGVPVCIHLFMCRSSVLVCEILATETNKAVGSVHMILYISRSVGCWTASTAHNIDNMFHMNPSLRCQRLATNATPASYICNVYVFWLVPVWNQLNKRPRQNERCQDKSLVIAASQQEASIGKQWTGTKMTADASVWCSYRGSWTQCLMSAKVILNQPGIISHNLSHKNTVVNKSNIHSPFRSALSPATCIWFQIKSCSWTACGHLPLFLCIVITMDWLYISLF